MAYNIVNQPMRDTADNAVTGWIRNGTYERYVPGLSTADTSMDGLAGLNGVVPRDILRMPAVGRKHIRAALADPEARPRVLAMLRGFDTGADMAAQAEADVAEYVRPTGRVIVFKDLARTLGSRVKRVEEAIAQALPTKPTEAGQAAAEIVAFSENPRQDLEELYMAVAYEAIAPGLEWSTEPEERVLLGELGGLKKSLKKLGQKAKKVIKKVGKPLAIAAGVVGAALLAPVVVPAIGSAVSAVGSAIGGVVSSIFGKKRTPQQEAMYVQADQLDAHAQGLERAGQAAAAAQMHAQAQMLRARADAPTPPAESPAPAFDFGVTRPKAPPPATPSIGFDQIAAFAMQIFATKQSGDAAGAKRQEDDLVAQLKAQGMADAEARALAQQALAQVAAQSGPSAPPMMFPSGMAPPDTEKPEPAKTGMGVGTLAAFALGAVILTNIMGKGRR